MHLGLHYGLENTSHYKCFQPSDISDLALHFDLSDIATHWVEEKFQYIKVQVSSGSFDVGSDEVSLVCNSSYLYGTDTTSANFNSIKDKPGVLKIENEYITYDSITIISAFTIKINKMGRGAFGSTEAAHANGVVANFLITDAKVDPRCFDRVGKSLFLDIESNPTSSSQSTPVKSGGYYLSSNSIDKTNFLGIHNANKALFFDGADDVLLIGNGQFTSTSLNSTYVFVLRIPNNSLGISQVNLDILLGGSDAGRSMMRISENAFRVRFNHDEGTTNAEQTLQTNNTDNGTSSVQFPQDSLQVITLTKNGNALELYYNNVLVAAETYTAVDSSVTGALIQAFGRREDAGGSNDAFCEYGEFLYYDKTLDSTERTELFNHLKNKWTGGL